MLHLREGRSALEQKIRCMWKGCHLLWAIYHGQQKKVMSCNVPGRPSLTFISTNNVMFGNKCPIAKDSPDFIDSGHTVLDFLLKLMYQTLAHLVPT